MRRKLLIIILLVAAFFRFFRLTSAPPGLNWDEASIGYNAYSILKTGRDEWGKLLPLSFKAFGEQKLPGMIYASIPGIAFFGLNDFGVRVTPAIIGVLAVYALYLLGTQLFTPNIGLLAAALLALSPWGVHFSRVSFEAGLSMLATILSMYFLQKSRTSSRTSFPLAVFFAIIAAYSYNSVRILLPLLFIALVKLGYINIKTHARAIMLGVLLLLPIFFELTTPEGRVRWGTVSIAKQESFFSSITESRGYTKLPEPFPRLIQNKFTHYIYAVGNNYLQMFSSDFLFFKGGINSQRSVQGMGLLYFFEFPLLVLGLIEVIRRKNYLLLSWLLLAPIPSILTIDSPSTVRALGMLPPLLLIEASGAFILIPYLRVHLKIAVAFAIFTIWCISYFGYQLWMVNPVKYSDKWLFGYRDAISYVAANYSNASKIYITDMYGEPYIFTLFYTQYDPHRFQTERVDREVDPTGWVHVSGFDKYRFTTFSGLESPTEIVARNHGNIVMIAGFGQLPGDFPRLLRLQAPNWKVMFEGTLVEGAQ